MSILNHHVFKGHKTLLGNRYVTYGELELDPRLNIFNHSRDGFDWGYTGSAPLQLAFAILCEIGDVDFAKQYKSDFAKDVVSQLKGRDWVLEAADVLEWINAKSPAPATKTKKDKKKNNVVKTICKELNITQKQLAHILEVPEGTVSSWAVKNEIPRLGRKAIEFYMLNQKNEAIVRKFKELLKLVNTI